MSCVIACECGRTLRAATLAEIVAEMRRHLAAEHPEIAGAPREDDLVAMAIEDDG